MKTRPHKYIALFVLILLLMEAGAVCLLWRYHVLRQDDAVVQMQEHAPRWQKAKQAQGMQSVTPNRIQTVLPGATDTLQDILPVASKTLQNSLKTQNYLREKAALHSALSEAPEFHMPYWQVLRMTPDAFEAYYARQTNPNHEQSSASMRHARAYYAHSLRQRTQIRARKLSGKKRRRLAAVRTALTNWETAYYNWLILRQGFGTYWVTVSWESAVAQEQTLSQLERTFQFPGLDYPSHAMIWKKRSLQLEQEVKQTTEYVSAIARGNLDPKEQHQIYQRTLSTLQHALHALDAQAGTLSYAERQIVSAGIARIHHLHQI